MGVDVRPSVLVRRPRTEVAGFMFNPANELQWNGGITSSRPAQDGRLVLGSTVERTARFLGRTFTYGYLVTAYDPDRLVEMTVERPFPMRVRYELSDAGEDTTVTIHAAGAPGRFFGWASPLMTRQVRKNITADLERLRSCLEHRTPGTAE